MHRDDQRPVRLSGRTVSSADVFDELEQFVDSEPVGWAERQPRRRGAVADEEGAADAADAPEPVRRHEEPAGDVAFSRAGAHRRTDELDAPISQAAGETAVSRRREAFAQRLSAELDRSAEPPAERPAPEVAREKVAPRFDRPVTTPTRPSADMAPPARPAAPPSAPRPTPDTGPARPDARAMPPAPSLTPEQPPAPRPPVTPAAPVATPQPVTPSPSAPQAPAIGGAGEPPAPELDFDDDDGPADALDWELDNAIGAIVASTHKKADEPDEGPAPAGPVAPSAAPQAEAAGTADAPQPQRQPEPAAPMDPPPTVVGTRRPRPVPTFRFERRTEDDEAETAAPPDFDNPLTSILFKDVRAKFDAVHPQPEDDDYDTGEDEFADYGAGDELEDEYAFDDAEADLPASLRRSGARRKRRMSGRAVGLLVVGAVGLAVVVVGGLIGLNVFAGGGVSGREPPVIHADARDVKVRATNITVDAEPDIMERTALGDTEELVLPDRVVIDRAQPPAVFEGDEDVPAEPRARRVVLRRDGTIVPAGATETRSVATSSGPPATSAPPVAQTPQAATDTGTASLGASRSIAASGADSAPPAVPGTGVPSAAAPVDLGAPDAAVPQDEGGTATLPDTATDTLADDTATDAGTPVNVTPRRRPAPPPRTSRVETAALAPQTSAPAAATTTATASAGAPWGVQVSSQRTEADAQQSYANFRARYGNIVGGLQPVIVAANVGDRGRFYRVRLPADTRGEAAALCQRLKSAGADCFIARN